MGNKRTGDKFSPNFPALKKAYLFNFPRSLNSEGEKRAQIELFKLGKTFDPEIEVDTFSYPKVLLMYPKIWQVIFFVITIGYFIHYIYLPFTLLTFLLTISSSILILGINLSIYFCLLHSEKKERKISQNFSKNFTINQKSTQSRELDAKMGLLILFVNYNTFKYRWHNEIPLRLMRYTPFFQVGFFLIYVFLGITRLNGSYFNSPLFSLRSNIAISITGAITLIILLISLINTEDQEDKEDPENTKIPMNLGMIFNLLEEIRMSHLDLKWIDIKIVFTGADFPYEMGTSAFLTTHSTELNSYKDLYFLRVGQLENPAIISNKTVFQQPSSIKIRDILIQLLKHLSRQIKMPLNDRSHYWKWMKYLSIPKSIRSYTSNIVTFGDLELSTKSRKKSKNNASTNTQILQGSKLLYNLILTLDKRIEDKIQTGE